MFGSSLARHKNGTKKSFFKKREVTVTFGNPIDRDIKAKELQDIVSQLKNENYQV